MIDRAEQGIELSVILVMYVMVSCVVRSLTLGLGVGCLSVGVLCVRLPVASVSMMLFCFVSSFDEVVSIVSLALAWLVGTKNVTKSAQIRSVQFI